MRKITVISIFVLSLFLDITLSRNENHSLSFSVFSQAIAGDDVERIVVTGRRPPPLPSFNPCLGGCGGGGGGNFNPGGGFGPGPAQPREKRCTGGKTPTEINASYIEERDKLDALTATTGAAIALDNAALKRILILFRVSASLREWALNFHRGALGLSLGTIVKFTKDRLDRERDDALKTCS